MENRDEILQLNDEMLKKRCLWAFFKGTGNGGQKRNKTSSAVRCTLEGTGFSAEDCSERSQLRNREAALWKLRRRIALEVRKRPPEMPLRRECALTHSDYPLTLARWLDALEFCGGDYRLAAERLGFTPSAFLKKLARDPEVWQKINRERISRGEAPLHE